MLAVIQQLTYLPVIGKRGGRRTSIRKLACVGRRQDEIPTRPIFLFNDYFSVPDYAETIF